MSHIIFLEDPADELRQYGVRSLIEQLGNEALDSPVNTSYRIADGYNASLSDLWVFRNGGMQDIGLDYNEQDARTIRTLVPMLNTDRIMAINIARDIGKGGLISIDRPPAGAGVGPYTTTGNFNTGDELFVWLSLLKQIEGVDYNITPPNQFTLLAIPPPGSVIIASIVRKGEQGSKFCESFPGFGAFPAFVPTVNPLDKNQDEILVYINGQQQSENFDYEILTTGVNVTRAIPGVNDIEVVAISSSQPSKWRT